MFNSSEALHWLMSQAVKLPLEKCVAVFDHELDLAEVARENIQQAARLYALFDRFDLLLVLMSISNQLPKRNDLIQKLSLMQLKEILNLLKNSENLNEQINFACWPQSVEKIEAFESAPPVSQLFIRSMALSASNSWFSLARNKKIVDYLLPSAQEQTEFVQQLSNPLFTDAFANVKAAKPHRLGLYANALFSAAKSDALQRIRKDSAVAFAVMQNEVIDLLATSWFIGYRRAYAAGWQPGRAFAYYLEHNPKQAQSILNSLPEQAPTGPPSAGVVCAAARPPRPPGRHAGSPRAASLLPAAGSPHGPASPARDR